MKVIDAPGGNYQFSIWKTYNVVVMSLPYVILIFIETL